MMENLAIHQEPYTYKRKHFLNFYGSLYSIIYDGTEIIKHQSITSAKMITAALNGAYFSGYVQGTIIESLENERKLNKREKV